MGWAGGNVYISEKKELASELEKPLCQPVLTKREAQPVVTRN